RIIALQEFAKQDCQDSNNFCDSLKKIHRDEWANHIVKYFKLDVNRLYNGNKDKTLDYIIGQLESKNVRVSRGVMNNNKLLPVENRVRSTYRKSSGFIVKDDFVPYIFLPSEISDDETPGRQILTLFSLLIFLGLGIYNLYLSGNYETKINKLKTLNQAFGVSSEILLPFVVSNKLSGSAIDSETCVDLSAKYMLTPSAIAVTLRNRDVIKTSKELDKLLNELGSARLPISSSLKRTPKIDTSVKKLCGTRTCNEIIEGLKTTSVKPIEAQYLMFGTVDKLKFEKFKANVGL
ncbi:MAG TPA: hypothetical protein PKD20_04090, partial [Candidatus Saccharibacteria bacterium]|nr:hypothetical protein [Candidatus Saccharibacteria bacterium]